MDKVKGALPKETREAIARLRRDYKIGLLGAEEYGERYHAILDDAKKEAN